MLILCVVHHPSLLHESVEAKVLTPVSFIVVVKGVVIIVIMVVVIIVVDVVAVVAVIVVVVSIVIVAIVAIHDVPNLT
jgi:hypothetical protein